MRRVKSNGVISKRGRPVYGSEALAGEPVALTETDGGRWTLHDGPILLGTLADRGDRLIRPGERLLALWTTQGVARGPAAAAQPQPQSPGT